MHGRPFLVIAVTAYVLWFANAWLRAQVESETVTLPASYQGPVCVDTPKKGCAPAAAVRAFIAGYRLDAGSETERLKTLLSLKDEEVEQLAAAVAQLRAQLAGPRISAERQALEREWRETLNCGPGPFSWPALLAKIQGRDGPAVCDPVMPGNASPPAPSAPK